MALVEFAVVRWKKIGEADLAAAVFIEPGDVRTAPTH